MIETGDIQVIIEDGTNANLCQQIAYIKAGKTEIEEAVQEGIGDFNTNATEKTNTFNSNASAKTLAFNQNADAKTLIYDNNASDKLTAYNENATNKLADFNTNATNKTTAFDLNATNKTNTFNNNASEKTTAFNDNAIAKTSGFNSNATSKTNDFNYNASNKTSAFNDNYLDKKALIDAEVQVAKDWATKTDGTVDGVDYSAKYYAQSILPIKDDITAVAEIATDVSDVAEIKDEVTAVAQDKENVDAVAENITNVNTVAGDHANIQTVVNNMTAINNAPTYANNSKIWAEGLDGEVAPLGGTHSSKGWAEIAEQAASGVQNPANRDLSNLTNTGQMIIDSVNGTISNCILEIPQNIKMEISGSNVICKAGSVLVNSGSTYQTITLTQDCVQDCSSFNDSTFLFMVHVYGSGPVQMAFTLDVTVSGATDSLAGTPWHTWFDTETKVIKRYGSDPNRYTQCCYPCALVQVTSGIPSFAKDSNGNDMIFNGAGFIGHHAFVYPNVKGLAPNEKNADGTLKSYLFNHQSLEIVEITQSIRVIGNNGSSVSGWSWYSETDDINNATFRPGERIYDSSTNTLYALNIDTIRAVTPLIFCGYNGTTITDFTIRQPVRLATTEMLDSLQSQVDTNTTAIEGKQDTLVSGTNIKTINSTTVLGSGNFTLADQSLSNLDSTGQMIIDSQNGTISNCILEIPQNVKIEIVNNVPVIKAGSTFVLTGTNNYSTFTNDSDVSVTSIPTGKFYLITYNYNGVNPYAWITFDNCLSGSSAPTTYDGQHTLYFCTDDKNYYIYQNDNWIIWRRGYTSYPIAAMEKDAQGNVTFLKDSKGHDLIFNGAGFIGHHAFVYPNIKALLPNGFNEDGSLSSTIDTSNALSIFEMGTANNSIMKNKYGSFYINRSGEDLDSTDEIQDTYTWHYIKSLNGFYRRTTELQTERLCLFIKYSITGTTVTDFTIRQPVRLATTEMLDKVQDQVDTNTTDIAGKQDTLVSGTNIKTINSTSVLGSGNFTLADQSLSNLDSIGQMVVDSQNGTISNCILEIPQNIKLTLENNVLTLKAGSVLVNSGSIYSTKTINSDIVTSAYTGANLKYMLFTQGGYIRSYELSDIVSGDTDSKAGTPWHCWFDTVNKNVNTYGSDATTPVVMCYPLCVIESDSNGVWSFSKDSNGNDMIFNGAGFIGHHAFVYPNIVGLASDGIDTDGNLKSTRFVTNALRITDMQTSTNNFVLNADGANIFFYSKVGVSEVQNYGDINPSSLNDYYVKSENKVYGTSGSTTLTTRKDVVIIDCAYDGTTVTDFTIRQPYEGARNLLTDDIEEQVEQNTADIATKQVDVTTLTGYDSTQTQTLKNINGVLTWVTD